MRRRDSSEPRRSESFKVNGNGNITGNFAKTLSRGRQRFLQNIGKSGKTIDSYIDTRERYFMQQRNEGKTLRKQVKIYTLKLKEMYYATETFTETLQRLYPKEWPGSVTISEAITSTLKALHTLFEGMEGPVLSPLVNYLDSFNDIKEKIEKRKRKLTDFDGAKRVLDQQKTSKKPDDAKIEKAQTEFNEAKSAYSDVTGELYELLPEFYDRRITVYCEHWLTMFNQQESCFSQLLEATRAMKSTIEQLNEEAKQGILLTPRVSADDMGGLRLPTRASSLRSLNSTDATVSSIPHDAAGQQPIPLLRSLPIVTNRTGPGLSTAQVQDNSSYRASPIDTSLTRTSSSNSTATAGVGNNSARPVRPLSDLYETIDGTPRGSASVAPAVSPKSAATRGGSTSPVAEPRESDSRTPMPTELLNHPPVVVSRFEPEQDNVYASIDKQAVANQRRQPTATNENGSCTDGQLTPAPSDSSQQVRYKVMAKYTYQARNEDELSLAKDDIIEVLPWVSEGDEEDGWLYGRRVSDGRVGLFPENHTRTLKND